ncbi:MAG: DUF4358 domain-containing protein [Bacilli bacterium]
MKKILLIVTLLLLTGCGKKLDLKKVEIDLDNLKIEDKFVYKDLKKLSSDDMYNIYSIESKYADEILYKENITSKGVDLYIVVKIKDDKIKEEIDKRFEALELQCDMYDQVNALKVKNRLETKIGSYNIYIISDNNELVLETIKKS